MGLESHVNHLNFCLNAHFKGLYYFLFNPITLRKTKIAYNYGLSECNRVKRREVFVGLVFLSTCILKVVYCFIQYCQKHG